MEALILALIPVMTQGVSISAALGSISLSTWIEIAAGIIGAAPTIKKALTQLHPVFDQIAKDIDGGIDNKDILGARANSFIARNAEAAIRLQESMDDREPA
jgi:hypothetical protein